MRDSMIFYGDWYEAIKSLPADKRLSMLDRIMSYGLYGECPDITDPMEAALFAMFKSRIDLDKGKYDAVVKRNKENGAKGGRPKKTESEPINNQTVTKQKPNQNQENPKNPVGYLETQENPEKPKKADNDNDNDCVNDNYHEDIIIPPIRNTTYCCSPHGGNDGQDMVIPEVENESSEEQTCSEPDERKKKVARKKKETDDAEEAEVLTWRNDFQTYLQECRDAWKRWVNDPQWMEERRKFNPGVDILLTLEKACKEFWATEAGWAHKKRQRSKTIDWKRTFESAISNKNNRVYEQRNSSNGPQSGGGIEDALRAAADGIRRARTKQPWESDDQPFAGADGVGWADPGFGR